MTLNQPKCVILALVQARSSSTRLPNKVLKPILGVPMILHQLERIERSKLINKLTLATSDDTSDDKLADLCVNAGYRVVRGPLKNVLKRFEFATFDETFDHIVRLTGDCPLSDPNIVNLVIHTHLDEAADYTSNALTPTFPDGLDVEVIKKEAFERVIKRAKLECELEHVTSYIYTHPNEFKISQVLSKVDLAAHRWTVDELVDFELITEIFTALYPHNPNFLTDDVLKFVSGNSSTLPQNKHIQRNEGFIRAV